MDVGSVYLMHVVINQVLKCDENIIQVEHKRYKFGRPITHLLN